LGPVDIAGIILAAVVALIVIFAVVQLATGRLFGVSWPHWRGQWVEEIGKGGVWQKQVEDQTVAGSFREVEIRGIAGSIEVSGGSGDGVRVHSVKTGTPRALEAIRVDIQKEGDRLLVSEKRESWGMMRPGSINFSITLPRGVTSVFAHTVSGSVKVRDVEPGVSQRLESVSGGISTSRAADLQAHTTSGSIDFVFAGRDLEARSISGAIDGTIDSIERGGSVRIGTISGSVDVDAPPSLDARLTLRSTSGSVSCGFPVTVLTQNRNSLEGTVGGGSIPVEITSTSGSISLRKK
jgi:DUF4097 and DUF4098 domain-containing protein YvlB